MEAVERRAGPRAMARDRAHMARRHVPGRGATRWCVDPYTVAGRATRHGFLRLFSARSMMLIAYRVNPYLFTRGKCKLSSSLSR
jgi:hypothetical protein